MISALNEMSDKCITHVYLHAPPVCIVPLLFVEVVGMVIEEVRMLSLSATVKVFFVFRIMIILVWLVLLLWDIVTLSMGKITTEVRVS